VAARSAAKLATPCPRGPRADHPLTAGKFVAARNSGNPEQVSAGVPAERNIARRTDLPFRGTMTTESPALAAARPPDLGLDCGSDGDRVGVAFGQRLFHQMGDLRAACWPCAGLERGDVVPPLATASRGSLRRWRTTAQMIAFARGRGAALLSRGGANLPLQDHLFDAADRAFGLDWRALLDWMNGLPLSMQCCARSISR